MIHSAKLYLNAFCAAIISMIYATQPLAAQDCQPDYILKPVTATNTIEWSKFPEFDLPFDIIYSGPRFGDTQSQPLKHGFSHISAFSGPEPGSLPKEKRAILWYGVATSSGNQPWADNTLRSPWGNDTAAYRSYWDNFANTAKDVDIVCLDIERMQREDRDILALKNDTRIPQSYRNLPDASFLATYKKDIRWWYTEAINRLKAKGVTATLTSYSDVPIRNTWLNITTNSWQDWTTNLDRTHYLTQDDAGKVGGSFYNGMDFLSPSPYYYYGYDHPIGKDYLSYLLFNIESNIAWSNKPVIPFVWMRIHDSYDRTTPLITPFAAEATAIFPFFSGAKGLWLWENPFLPGDRQEVYAPYEHFIHGLYRLSAFKDMFQGDYELVIPQSARDQMQLQNPLWRGVVKGTNILIAAQNPYAADDQVTEIAVSYQNWSRMISVKGKEIFLCKFDLNDVVNGRPELSDAYIYPTVTSRDLNVVLTGSSGFSDVEFALVNAKGQTVYQTNVLAIAGQVNRHIELPVITSGIYFARFTTRETVITKKLVIVQ